MEKIRELINQSAEFKRTMDISALNKVNQQIYQARQAIKAKQARVTELRREQGQIARAEAYALTH